MIIILFGFKITYIMDICSENKKIKRIICICICLLMLVIAPFKMFIEFVSTSRKNAEKAALASTHYESWLEQLPTEHPIKKDFYELSSLYRFQNILNTKASAYLDSAEQIIKYQLSSLDLTGTGILDAYLSQKFDELKPEYILLDEVTNKTLNKIKLSESENKSVKLYRNGKEIPFSYIPPENAWKSNNRLELHELISLGFVKAYVQNPDIAKIVDNQITAIAKGKTKLILIYGTQLLEFDIVVKR